MAEKFRFACTHDVDLIFKYGDRNYNFGYNYNMYVVPSVWIYHKQVTGKNLFTAEKIRTSRKKEKLERNLEESVSAVIDASKNLPLDIKEFNLFLGVHRLNGFGSGIFNTLYKWSLGEDKLFHLTAKEKSRWGFNGEIFALSPENDGKFLSDYLKFLRECPHMGGCYDWCSTIVNRLKKVE